LVRLSFNENPYGPSRDVADAIQREFNRLNRYADSQAALRLAEQIATYEHVPAEQVVLGEILDFLGLYLGSQGGPGGEFIYSTPGYLALIDAAARVGGVGVPVPLNAQYQNDLPALSGKVNQRTRAIDPTASAGITTKLSALRSSLYRPPSRKRQQRKLSAVS
jgi:histidinol-phosphate aminotransferase